MPVNSIGTSDGQSRGTGIGLEGRTSTMVEDAMNYGSQAGGYLKGAFNWVSNAMDENPVATKWIVGGLAFLGMLQFGINRGWLTMLGDNIVGRTISFALMAALSLGGASLLSDWASNKGASQRAGNTGRIGTATVPATQEPAQKGTSVSFNNKASSADLAPPTADSAADVASPPPVAAKPPSPPLTGLDAVFSGPG